MKFCQSYGPLQFLTLKPRIKCLWSYSPILGASNMLILKWSTGFDWHITLILFIVIKYSSYFTAQLCKGLGVLRATSSLSSCFIFSPKL